jgi:hypothetical protein
VNNAPDKSLWPIENGVEVRYVVDGHEFPNEDANLMGDGEYPPFLVFDVDAQDYVGGTYPTRDAAQVEATRLNETGQS